LTAAEPERLTNVVSVALASAVAVPNNRAFRGPNGYPHSHRIENVVAAAHLARLHALRLD
jgi:hypothetical protein